MSLVRQLSGASGARLLTAALIATALTASATTASAGAQTQADPALPVSPTPAPFAPPPTADDPKLFDLELAQDELSALERTVAELQASIADAIEDIDGLTVERNFLDMNRPERAEALQQARTQARQMSVAAYVGIGPPLSGLQLLSAETASDMSWRNALLQQQAERLNTAATTYAVLSGEADANVLSLSDDINAETRQLEAINRELSRATREIPMAEWYVQMATIHSFAVSEFARTGRGEPSAEQWGKLRFCESTETYNIDSGNTFYGAYQFTLETWTTVGGQGSPAQAPAAEQDARARLLYAQRGHQPWPICGRHVRYPAG